MEIILVVCCLCIIIALCTVANTISHAEETIADAIRKIKNN